MLVFGPTREIIGGSGISNYLVDTLAFGPAPGQSGGKRGDREYAARHKQSAASVGHKPLVRDAALDLAANDVAASAMIAGC